MIRSSRHTLKYTNKNKTELLDKMYLDYTQDLQTYINLIINKELPLLLNLSSKLLPSYNITHSQWKQVIYKQASGIIRSNINYIKNKTFKRYKKVYKYFIKKNRMVSFTSKHYNELNIKLYKRIKIDIKNISINLDNRLFDIKKGTSFDEFIRIKSPYFIDGKKRAKTINIPINYHKYSNKYIDWKRNNTIQLKKINNSFYLSFSYEKEIDYKEGNNKIGIDLGIKKLISTSTGNYYGSEIEKFYSSLANKKRGSKRYKKQLIHRKNVLNRTIKEMLVNENPTKIVVEDLKELRKNSKLSRKVLSKQQYFIYAHVLNHLHNKSEEQGIVVEKVSPAYTSQTCSRCGNIDKSSRKEENYVCISCGFEIDADYNASINILHRGEYNPSNTTKEKELVLC